MYFFFPQILTAVIIISFSSLLLKKFSEEGLIQLQLFWVSLKNIFHKIVY